MKLGPDEQAIFILAARLVLSSSEAARFEALARALREPSWVRTCDAASRYRISNLLRKHLKDRSLFDRLPPRLSLRLDQVYKAESLRALRKYSQLARIVDVATHEGIDLILLKGTYLARWVYIDPALRPFNDFDLMCRLGDIPAMKRVLIGLGYIQDQPVPHSRIHACFMKMASQHLPAFLQSGWPSVELHTRPTAAHPSQGPQLDTLWSRAVKIDWEGRRAFSLSVEDQFTHLSIHLAQHMDSGLIKLFWLADLHEMARRSSRAIPPIDYSRIFAMSPSGPSDAALRRAYIRVLKQIRLIPSPSDRLLFLWKQLIPDRAYIRYRYDISPRKAIIPHYLYHLYRGIRPFLRRLNLFR